MRILRMNEVVEKTGLCRAEIYSRLRKNEFPRSIPLGPKIIGFPEHEIDAWIAERIAERDSRREPAKKPVHAMVQARVAARALKNAGGGDAPC